MQRLPLNKTLNALREERNVKLAETDWVVIKEREEGGSVSNFADWKTYRQALRDITNSATSLDDVTWPGETIMTLIKINNRGASNTERGRNLLYNGDMSVWQRLNSNGRNAPTTSTVSSSTYNNSTTTYPHIWS